MDSTLCLPGFLVPGTLFCRGCGRYDSFPTAEAQQSVQESEIGVVVFLTHMGEQAEAILDVEGVWRCPKLPVLNRALNGLYAPRRDSGDDAPFGLAELLRVASWLKGVAKVHCT